MRDFRQRLRIWLQGFSPQTCINLLIICLILHIIAFGQFALPFFPPSTKKTIGVVVFSLAKAFQYTGLSILGVEGYKKLKDRILKRNTSFRMPAKRSKRPHNKHRLKRMRKANRKTDAPISQTKA